MNRVHVIVFVVLLPALMPTVVVGAQDAGLEESVRPSEVGHGSLLFWSENGRYRRAPNQSTEVEITVQGMLAEAVVKQRFVNPGDDWVEGIYVFPLPADTAVHAMRLQVGDRIIEGQVKERAEAKRTYEKAKRQGKKASLVEQERPNVFTISVANIGPGEEVSVEIAYQEILEYDTGRFELRFPMVVGPRFIPGRRVEPDFGGTGWAFDTDEVPDASRVTPPVVHPSEGRVNPVTLQVTVDAGLALESVACRSHDVRITKRRRSFSVALDAVPADRDFVLEWRPQRGERPRAAVFAQERDGWSYVLAMIVPPGEGDVESVRLARESVFVIDTSGSMGGASIRQARQALELALDSLRPEDWFNVIEFNSSTRRLFRSSRQALPVNIDEARAWVRRLDASGGTQMMPALMAALEDSVEHTHLRQVVFITDGCVGNEEGLFQAIVANLGRSRLFTVGIGSAPNAHFMERAAGFGRGSSTFIERPSEAALRMGELFAKIENPVLADVELAWPDPGTEAWPERIPDLYVGEPLVVVARMGTMHGDLTASGVLDDSRWNTAVALDANAKGAGINRLWARRKIAALMDRKVTGTPEAEVRERVLEVALEHGLVSRYTSLVAVDVTPTRPSAEGLSTRAVPTNLPAGWEWNKVFGAMPRGGTASRLHLLTGLIVIGLALLARVVAGARR
ncbi:MAG: marine proteobacterial sortase target protein [Thermoanaerobaculales bacterium]|jgi:Ca-activated chloride channel family protein|nr:marine proteobacterial sortase target protein [Thermoanaerobaculales bacterium]